MASLMIGRVAGALARKSLMPNCTRALLRAQNKVSKGHCQLHTTSRWLQSGQPVKLTADELQYTESLMRKLGIKGSSADMEKQLDVLAKESGGLKGAFRFGGVNFAVDSDELNCLKKADFFENPPLSLAPLVLKESGMTEKEIADKVAKMRSLKVRRLKGQGNLTSDQMKTLLGEGGEQDFDTVSADQVQAGDIVEVKPGGMFPVDGRILATSASDVDSFDASVQAGMLNEGSSKLILAEGVGAGTNIACIYQDLTELDKDELCLDSLDPTVASYLNYHARYIRNITNYPRYPIRCIVMFGPEDTRDVGCLCDEEQEAQYKYMTVHKYQPRRCECGCWFCLIPEAPATEEEYKSVVI